METFPEVDVIRWDADSYHIQCPFCEAVHVHGVNWSAGKLRDAHCEKRGSYSCCFPMNDQGEVAYEIDKRRGQYTNICVSHDSDTEDDDDVNHLASELAQKATVAAQEEDIDEDSREVVTIVPGRGIEQKRIFGALSDCVTGDTTAVRRYLETSSEANLFVRGRDYMGKTTLIIAAAEQTSEMVLLLIKHKAEVNAIDNHGRSALMEAALFGWIDNVKVLLQHNADRNIRDGDNRLAIDLARDHCRNRRERYRRGYIEDTFKRDIDRQEIVRLLGGENQKSKIVFGSPPTLSPS